MSLLGKPGALEEVGGGAASIISQMSQAVLTGFSTETQDGARLKGVSENWWKLLASM